jgi:predicted DNA binding CopG/RHH family protein
MSMTQQQDAENPAVAGAGGLGESESQDREARIAQAVANVKLLQELAKEQKEIEKKLYSHPSDAEATQLRNQKAALEQRKKDAQVKLSISEAIEAVKRTEKITTHTVIDQRGRRRKFKGIWLAGTSDRWAGAREASRWTEQDLYLLESGKFLVATAYRTMWQGESDEYEYKILDTIEKIDSQILLDELRDNLCKKFNAKIPLSEVALPLEEEE